MSEMQMKIAIIQDEIRMWEATAYRFTTRAKVAKEAGMGEQYLEQQIDEATKAQKMVDGLKKIVADMEGGG
jgi:hypothetical protein